MEALDITEIVTLYHRCPFDLTWFIQEKQRSSMAAEATRGLKKD